jgi:hypothetical protein
LRNPYIHGAVCCLTVFTMLAALSASPDAQAKSDPLIEALADGKFYLNLRYRFEHVNDDFEPGGQPLKNANASTLRTVLGYRSGDFHGFSFLVEMEQISRVFSGDFFEGSGTANTDTATVADPDGTKLGQGYLRYQAPGNNDMRFGRQQITYRDAPFHRHIGTILWRQNWQTFDAVTLSNTYLPDTRLSYAYVWRVNRIFGRSAPEPLSHFRSDSHFINLRHNRFSWAQVEGYAYLFDFDNAPRFSAQTYGARLHGSYPLNDWFSPLYTVEYAHQSDYGTNTTRYSASYQLFEAGFRLKPTRILDSVMLKFGFERLSGDGTPNGAFVTVLGTNHAFQGTADRFLITPDDGIRDYHLRTVMEAWGFRFNLGYHMLRSDNLDYRYGDELDVELTRGFGKHVTIGLKYADYKGDGNTLNLIRNPVLAADVKKAWVYVMANF